MPGSEHLSDDYVAQLLAKDAKTSNAKYSAYGLQELLPRRLTYHAPKPNTRFLKNIIRETNSHNAALQAKELEESRARVRSIHGSDGRAPGSRNVKRVSKSDNHHFSKRRRVDIEYQEKRPLSRDDEGRLSRLDRDDDHQSNGPRRKQRDDHYESEDSEEKLYRERRHRHYHRTHHRRHDDTLDKHDQQISKRRRRSRSRHRSPLRSPLSAGKSQQHHHRSHRSARSSSSTTPDRNGHHGSVSRVIGRETTRRSSASDIAKRVGGNSSPGSDSDPLDAIIGPPPPPPAPKVQARGRGNFSSSSAIDSHFSSTYDPSVDVHPDPEVDDDWDQALEAIRDRQRWQKLGAERLKSAGFTEEEVKKWEKGGEKTEDDVKWAGRGEGREWDRGKVVGEDGVEARPGWGRLKEP